MKCPKCGADMVVDMLPPDDNGNRRIGCPNCGAWRWYCMGKFRVYWTITGNVVINADSKQDAKDTMEELWQREELKVVLRELTDRFDEKNIEIEICDEETIEDMNDYKQ